MPSYSQGAVAPYQVASVVPNEVFGIAINWFAPRTPLLARLPKIPDGSPVFQMIGHQYRPRTGTTNAAIANSTGTSLTLVDVSFLMQGDILKLAGGEYVECTGDPDTTNNTIAVRRGIAGSTAATSCRSSPATPRARTKRCSATWRAFAMRDGSCMYLSRAKVSPASART